MDNKLVCPNCGQVLERDYINSYGIDCDTMETATIWHYCPSCKKEIEIKYNLVFKSIKVMEEK